MSESKERSWHRCFGHINEHDQNLVKMGLVNHQLDCNKSGRVGTCEVCIGGKQTTKLPFQSITSSTSELLELVHSDLCGKMGEKLLHLYTASAQKLCGSLASNSIDLVVSTKVRLSLSAVSFCSGVFGIVPDTTAPQVILKFF